MMDATRLTPVVKSYGNSSNYPDMKPDENGLYISIKHYLKLEVENARLTAENERLQALANLATQFTGE